MIHQIWFQNRQNIEKIRPQKTKEAQNVVFNLKVRIPLLFYCVKHIFTNNLKLRNIHFKQISKNYPDCWEKPCRDILLNPIFCIL
jgi:hypothetical protein